MGSLWLKIKVWTKGILFAAVVAYALLFILNNSGQPVDFWYWFDHKHPTSALVLMVVTFFAGAISTFLVRTTFTTIRQIRELRKRGRIERLEKEHAAMKARAAMLQKRTAPASLPLNSNDQTPMTNPGAPGPNDQ